MLFNFLHKAKLKIGPLRSFVEIRDFNPNDEKYSPTFLKTLVSQMGREFMLNSSGAEVCTHITTPHARNACMKAAT